MNFRMFLVTSEPESGSFLITFLITVAIAVILTAVSPKKYEATTFLLFNFGR
jgi:uncharacterized protein involved in exopolysaccharide biosynthesis